MTVGIYVIKNIKNGKLYVGSSKRIEKRKLEHFSMLEHNCHHSVKLQNSWNRTNVENRGIFIHEIVEVVEDVSIIKIREQYYLDLFDAYENGYNCTKVVDNPKYTMKNIKKRNKKEKERIKLENFLFWQEESIKKYYENQNSERIFFRKSFKFQIEKYNGGYYKEHDFKFLYKIFDYFYGNFNTEEYSLSVWRCGASITKNIINNSEPNEEVENVVNYRLYYSTKDDEIAILYKDKSYFDYFGEKYGLDKEKLNKEDENA